MKAKKHFDLLPKNGLYINPPAISLIDHLPKSTAKQSQRKTPDKKRNDGNRVYGYSIHLCIFSPYLYYKLYFITSHYSRLFATLGLQWQVAKDILMISCPRIMLCKKKRFYKSRQ